MGELRLLLLDLWAPPMKEESVQVERQWRRPLKAEGVFEKVHLLSVGKLQTEIRVERDVVIFHHF